jgi:hypothetical protein
MTSTQEYTKGLLQGHKERVSVKVKQDTRLPFRSLRHCVHHAVLVVVGIFCKIYRLNCSRLRSPLSPFLDHLGFLLDLGGLGRL